MDEEYKPFVAFEEEHVDPNSGAPKICLEIWSPSDELSLTSEFTLFWTIRQKKPPGRFGRVQPLFVNWDPFSDALSQGRLVLLEPGEAGPKRVDVPPLSYVPASPWGHNISCHSAVPLRQASWPMQKRLVQASYLTANYQMCLCPGKKYALVLPGQVISFWGRPREDGMIVSNGSTCILPASSAGVVTFQVKHDSIPWPGRPEVTNEIEFERANNQESAWRTTRYWAGKFPAALPRCPSEAMHGAPVLSMSISAPYQWQVTGSADITITVTYPDGPAVNSGPITFYNHSFYQGDYGNGQNGIALYRLIRRSDGTKVWKRCQSKYTYHIAPRPPFHVPGSIRVGDELDPFANRFTTLFPGQSWSISRRFHDPPSGRPYEKTLPEDARPEDKFLYMFKGVAVAWWDWGTKADQLAKGAVYSPTWFFSHAWVDRMQLEADRANGQRPRLLVGASNKLRFTMVE